MVHAITFPSTAQVAPDGKYSLTQYKAHQKTLVYPLLVKWRPPVWPLTTLIDLNLEKALGASRDESSLFISSV
jgi:hypothetical protein